MRVSQSELISAAQALSRAAIGAGYLPPAGTALTVEMGSRTNGAAYLLTYLPIDADARSQGAQRSTCPLISQGVIGRTMAEAYDRVTTLTYALDAIARRYAGHDPEPAPGSVKCQTIGCRNRAAVKLNHGSEDDRTIGEAVCVECGNAYLRRPALDAELSGDQNLSTPAISSWESAK